MYSLVSNMSLVKFFYDIFFYDMVHKIANNRFSYSQEQFLNCYLACFFNKKKLILSGVYTVTKVF